jgi:hypothetical protein
MIVKLTPAVLLTAACMSALGADNTLTQDEKRAGFKLLFDGKTFAGWRDPAGEQPPGDSWVIDDGCLKTTPKPRITEDLISQESYGDFELKFDWKISPRGNTGVKYRIQRTIFLGNSKAGRKGGFEASLEHEVASHASDRATMAPGDTAQEYTVSYEFQLIDDTGGRVASVDGGVHDIGALYCMIPPRTKAHHPPLEWNTGRLVVKGNHFEHWINGVLVLDGALDSDQARAGTAKRWANAPTIREMLIQPRPAGPLSLQHHGAAVWFKNLKIRRL